MPYKWTANVFLSKYLAIFPKKVEKVDVVFWCEHRIESPCTKKNYVYTDAEYVNSYKLESVLRWI